MDAVWVLHDAAPAGGVGVVVAADVFEFPVGVTLEVETCVRASLVRVALRWEEEGEEGEE